MPRISEFYGIAVYMYYHDRPPAHFHAIYGEYEATVDIETAQIEDGEIPRHARSLVLEWAAIHRDKLATNWYLARANQPLNPIPPLE